MPPRAYKSARWSSCLECSRRATGAAKRPERSGWMRACAREPLAGLGSSLAVWGEAHVSRASLAIEACNARIRAAPRPAAALAILLCLTTLLLTIAAGRADAQGA